MKVLNIGRSLKDKIEETDFLSAYYGKQIRLFKRAFEQAHSFLTETWLEADLNLGFSSLDLTRLIFHGFPVDMNKVVTNGNLDFEKVIRIHKGGATLIVNGIENRSNTIYYLSQILENHFDCRVHCNLYATPGGMAGFKPHNDKHDVFVIQIKGSKNWSFYKTKDESAPEFGKKYSSEEIELISEHKLEEGDMLYVPRGLIHAAKGTDQTSWHLTFGLTGYYWQDALKDIINQASIDIPQLNRQLPTSSGEISGFNQQASHLLDQVKERVNIEKGIKSFQKEFPNLGEQLHKIPLPDGQGSTEIKPNTSFRMVSESVLTFETIVDGTTIQLPYRRFPLKLNKDASILLAEIRDRKEFKAQDLHRGNDMEQSLLLLYYLWINGIIENI